jgi:hypothetical protein
VSTSLGNLSLALLAADDVLRANDATKGDEWARLPIGTHAEHAREHIEAVADMLADPRGDEEVWKGHRLEEHLSHALCRLLFAVELYARSRKP